MKRLVVASCFLILGYLGLSVPAQADVTGVYTLDYSVGGLGTSSVVGSFTLDLTTDTVTSVNVLASGLDSTGLAFSEDSVDFTSTAGSFVGCCEYSQSEVGIYETVSGKVFELEIWFPGETITPSSPLCIDGSCTANSNFQDQYAEIGVYLGPPVSPTPEPRSGLLMGTGLPVFVLFAAKKALA